MGTKDIIIGVLMVIVIIGGYFTYTQLKKAKKEDGLATILFTKGMLLIVLSSSRFIDKILVGIGIITKHDNPISLTSDFNIYYFVLGCILLSLSVALSIYSRKKLYVLNINGYSKKRLESYIPTIKVQNFEFREREIDFVNIYNYLFGKKKDIDSFECIKAEIKDKVTAFKNETTNITKGYTGIAPIPFIMYAGTFMDRVRIDKYYEYDKVETNTYYTIKDKKFGSKYPKLIDYTNYNDFNKSKREIVIALSITLQITEHQIKQFEDKANIIMISAEKLGDNTIKYKEQLKEYVNTIIDKLEEVASKYPDITKIHLVYSGQSCLAFELGKRCVDSTRIPRIISYQYENQNNIKYPWGVVINGTQKGELVIGGSFDGDV